MKKASIKYLLISLLIVASLLLGSACELAPADDTTEESTTEETAADATGNTPADEEWTIPISDGQTTILPSIVDVVAAVKPSVVAINTEVVGYDVFNRPYTQAGAGSGWIIDESGYIVTNNHVVEGAESITVTLDDGRTLSADMGTVATDPLTDLAVLKVEAEDLPALVVRDSSYLRVGDWVVAIGNALGLGISATHGIVSRTDVSLELDEEQTLYDLIQTNAAINPGNSGGPLVNMAGEVIGITSAKISASGVEGMGYAISSQEAIPIIQELINTGYVVRPWLGVGARTVNQTLVFWYNLATDSGAFLVSVTPGGPADTAGLREGDIIVSLGDKEITNTQDLQNAIHSFQIGEEIVITFWRGSTQMTTTTTLIESPPP
jgi:serine protease Do